MTKIIMTLNGTEYISAHEWDSLEEFYDACPLENEFPDYEGDGSEGGYCYYELEKQVPTTTPKPGRPTPGIKERKTIYNEVEP